jgi:DNA-binding beta-propeller fold protein YncE
VSDEDNHRVQVYRVDDGSHVRVISSQGGTAGLLQDPRGITLSPDGKLLVVADFGNHRVQVFSTADGSHVRTIGCGGDLLPSHGPGELYNPAGVAVSPDGQFLYVADFGDHAIEFYHFNNASFIRRVGSQPHEPGRGPDEFDHPHDVFVSHSGEFLYVADMMNDRVQVLRAKDGEFVKFIGERGQKRMQFKHPLGLALSEDGKWLYVSDFGNDRVQMLKVA